MKRRIIISLFVLSLMSLVSLTFSIAPVAANEDIYLGDGEWCTDQGDGLWFCFEEGPTYREFIDSYSTTA